MASFNPVNQIYNRAKIDKIIYNDRCGYAIIFYEPVSDNDTKNPSIKTRDLRQTIPLQRKSYKPAGRPVIFEKKLYSRSNETAKEYIHRILLERKMDDIRSACYNVKKSFEKAEMFDMKRREFMSPRVKNRIRGKSSDEICEILLDDVMQNVDYIHERSMVENPKKKQTKKVNQNKDKTENDAYKLAAKYPQEKPKPLQKIRVQPIIEEEKQCSEECCSNVSDESVKNDRITTIPPLNRSIQIIPRPKPLDCYGEWHRKHLELMRHRQIEAEIFEETYLSLLRRLKRDIRNFELKYSL